MSLVTESRIEGGNGREAKCECKKYRLISKGRNFFDAVGEKGSNSWYKCKNRGTCRPTSGIVAGNVVDNVAEDIIALIRAVRCLRLTLLNGRADWSAATIENAEASIWYEDAEYDAAV